MILAADEGLDKPIVDALRAAGHEVIYVAELDPSISDSEVLAIANRRGAVLITADKDFGELVFRRGLATSGIILVRLAGLSAVEKARYVGSAISNYGPNFVGAFSVITPGIVRIRRQMHRHG